MIPGEIRTRPEPVDLNAGAERKTIVLVNTGDRPIQIGSHLHLPDANPYLQFDREAARKHRLDIPAGTSIRLEPGVSRTVEIVPLRGAQRVPGLQIKADEPVPADAPARQSRKGRNRHGQNRSNRAR